MGGVKKEEAKGSSRREHGASAQAEADSKTCPKIYSLVPASTASTTPTPTDSVTSSGRKGDSNIEDCNSIVRHYSHICNFYSSHLFIVGPGHYETRYKTM